MIVAHLKDFPGISLEKLRETKKTSIMQPDQNWVLTK
jgi:hypothetical protein